MKLLLLLAALSVGAATAPKASGQAEASQTINALFEHIELLEKRQQGQDTQTKRELDRQIEALKPEILKFGAAALAPLAAIAADAKRPEKTRLWAESFLALTRDPGALDALGRLLEDPKAPELLRADSASAIPTLEVSADAQRRVLCGALGLELPPEALGQALFSLARLGCEDSSALARRAKERGARPKKTAAVDVAHALEALGHSPGQAAARALWRLFDFFPKGSLQRGQVLAALLEARQAQLGFLAQARGAAEAALSAEADFPENAAAAARLLASFDDPGAADTLLRFLKHRDAEVVTLCAEGLSRLKDRRARAPVKAILDGVASDPRFAPAPGRPDPGPLARRLQDAFGRL